MEAFKELVDRYTGIAVVVTAIANVLKFALARDAAALYTVGVIGAASFIALAVYMKYFAATVTKTLKKVKSVL